MICYLLKENDALQVAKALNLKRSTVYCHIRQVAHELNLYEDIRTAFKELTKILGQMKIKISVAQLESLYVMVGYFLSEEPQNDVDDLLLSIMAEISEKLDRKIKKRTDNLSLNEAQVKAFVVWYKQKAGLYERLLPHAYLTCQMIIQEIGPIENPNSKIRQI